MRDPRNRYARVLPELTRFDSADEARAALRAHMRQAVRSPAVWLRICLMIAGLIGGTSLLVYLAIPYLGAHGAPPWLVGGLTGFLVGGSAGYGANVVFRRPLRRYLRNVLVEKGVPICLPCGYDLRGLPEPRCPECGEPFDRALLEASTDTPPIIE